MNTCSLPRKVKRKRHANCKMQTAISPSLLLPVAQRECTGCCKELHSHMAKSESDTDKHNLYLYGLKYSN